METQEPSAASDALAEVSPACGVFKTFDTTVFNSLD